jgi:hypothetical protein
MHEILGEGEGTKTSLDRRVGPGRRLALIRGELDVAKEIAHRNGTTVNDVLLSMIAGGVRGLLIHRGEPVDGLTMRIFVPRSLDPGPGRVEGNAVGQMIVPLPVGEADPVRRLRLIAAATSERKARARPSVGVFIHSRIAGRAILRFIDRQRVNLASADLPGPPTPLFFAGARMEEVFPVIPLIGNVSIGVGALSYTGSFNSMVVADADAVPDIDVFTDSARNELEALAGRDRRPALAVP